MTPRRNVQRRQLLADAAIEVLGTRGTHELSHRAVDEAAALPPGTTTNYFKTREELLEAAAGRVADLQLIEMSAAARTNGYVADEEGVAILIGRSLYEAATHNRTRLLAIYELSLEATRRPELLEALSRIATATLESTVEHHRALGLRSSPQQIQALITLFGGSLFTLVTAPPASVTSEMTNVLARCIVSGVMGALPDPPLV